jgi:DNA-binding CsgD family transcriptional regulator
MSQSTRPTYQQMLEVMRLMADVTALKGDVPAQRQLLIDGLNQITGTNQAFFFVAAGWRPGEKPHFTHQTLGKDRDPVFLRYMAEFGVRYPLQADPFCDVSIGDPSSKQLLTFEQALPNRAAEREFDAFMEIRRSGRVTDGVVGITRLTGNQIAGVGMHQFGAAGRLTARQRAIVEFAVGEIDRLILKGHLPLPPVQPTDLPPRLRQILDRLLSGQTPKQIARELGLSVWTVREHIQRVYQHYNVSGREELTARFVRE